MPIVKKAVKWLRQAFSESAHNHSHHGPGQSFTVWFEVRMSNSALAAIADHGWDQDAYLRNLGRIIASQCRGLSESRALPLVGGGDLVEAGEVPTGITLMIVADAGILPRETLARIENQLASSIVIQHPQLQPAQVGILSLPKSHAEDHETE